MPHSWLHTAAKNGDSEAQLKVGLICYMGHDAFQNFDFTNLTFNGFKGLCKNSIRGIKKAIFWIKKSSIAEPKYDLLLAYLHELLLPSVTTKTKSLFYYKKSFSSALDTTIESDAKVRSIIISKSLFPQSATNFFSINNTSQALT
jgi:TPR repeat protein